MKTIKTIASSNKTASVIDFSDQLEGLSRDQKSEVLDIIGETLVDQILLSCADETSPIDGNGSFKRLSKKYAEKKLAETGSDDANLDLNGEMLNALEYSVRGDKLELGVFGSDAPKADGHNNFSGKSKLPTRQFLPKEGQEFSSGIQSLIDDTINTYVADNTTLDKKKLDSVNSKADLYNLLKEEFGDLARSELKSLVLRSELAIELQNADLLDYL